MRSNVTVTKGRSDARVGTTLLARRLLPMLRNDQRRTAALVVAAK